MGTFSRFLLQESITHLILIEPDSDNISRLQAQYRGNPRVEIRPGFLDEHAASLRADSVVATNVLEHIEDDVHFLRTAHQILDKQGTLLLFVPALTWLYSTIDQVHGHFRRYGKKSLGEKIERSGFKILDLFYFNFPGILSWFVAGKILRQKTIPRMQVLFYDRWIVPETSALEKRWRPPLGQSLVAIAQK